MNDLVSPQAQYMTLQQSEPQSVFGDITMFRDTLQMAEYLSQSTMVPQQYQRQPANCVIALEMSQRMQASVLMVMQNLYVVHGKPGWSAQYLIACLNQSGKFSPLEYEFTGKENTDEWTCRAFASNLKTGDVVHGPSVSIAMSKAEGWYNENGSKWKTMPELMLTYRAAAFFIRTKAPEISMGMQTVDEIRDMGPVEIVQEEEIPSGSAADLVKKSQPSKQKKPAEKSKAKATAEGDANSAPDNVAIYKGRIDACESTEALKAIADEIGDGMSTNTATEYKEVLGHYKDRMQALKVQEEQAQQ